MKKIIYMFAFGIALLGFSSQTSAAWNTYPSDCPNPLSIGNYTTGSGIQDGSNGCWTRKSVSAEPGQTINVAVYYDNTNNADANNVVINLNQNPAGSMSSKNGYYSFSGNLSSSVGSLNLSQVTVNISNPETLTFSRAKWYKKADANGISLPGGQTGYEAFSGGLDMGTITKGDWGTILFSFTIGKSVAPQLCTDPNATNVGGPLPCTYPAQLCKDTNASNYNHPLPCTYPAQLCKDQNATNYNQPLPCTYPQLCKDVNASNYNHPLPCTYPAQLCKDTSATNYNQPLPCTYAQLCKDTSASNYNHPLPCTYPAQLCKDINASNYNYPLPCTYPVLLCKDLNATNYNSPLPCNYPARICLDSTASNYRGLLPCTYPVRICQDPSASNYRGILPCEYPVRICTDVNANNYRGSLPCDYTVRICQDSGATNYRGALPCRYEYVQPQLCRDTYATNYNGTLPCRYPVVERYCQDVNATNYRGLLPCTYYQTQQYCQDTSANNYRGPLPCTYTTYVNKNVVTTVSTNVTKNSAQLNGYITNTTYYNSDTYFEYGTSVNLGSRTASKNTIGNSNMSDYITGLSPNTIYYFRAVGDGPTGISKGSIEIFRTLADGAAVKPIIIQGTTIIGTASPVLLQISNKYQLINAGDLMDYVVTYKNIGSSKLMYPMVQVVLPTNVTLINSSRGTYAVDTHTLSAQIPDLNPGEEGAIYLQAKVDSIPLNNSQIATTAILVYTSSNGSQENAMAYVINVPAVIGVVGGATTVVTDASLLGGAAFFGGLLSIGFIGWLIIILLILLIILIARSYSNNRRVVTQETVTHTTTH